MSPTTGVPGWTNESVSEPRGLDSRSVDDGEPTVASVPAGPTRTPMTEPVLPSTCTSDVHGDTATTRPARPSAVTTVESTVTPSRAPTSMVRLRPPSGLTSLATTRAATSRWPAVVAPSSELAESLLLGETTLLVGDRRAQQDVLRLEGRDLVARRPGERALHRPEHGAARAAHGRGDAGAGEVGPEQRERGDDEPDEEAALVGLVHGGLEPAVPDEHALEAREVVDAATGTACDGPQRVVGDVDRAPRARGASARRGRAAERLRRSG